MGIYVNPGNIPFRDARFSNIYRQKYADLKDRCGIPNGAEVHICQPSAPFWQINGGEYADSLL